MRSIWFLLMSDLHIGSALALWPPDLPLSTGNKVVLNEGQVYLAKNFEIIRARINMLTGGRLAGVAFVGDLINGPIKDVGDFNIENRLSHQARAATIIIKPFVEMADSVWICQGTKWHVGEFANQEDRIGEAVGAEKSPRGIYVWEWIPTLNVHGFIMDIAHNQSYTMVNRSMPLERELRYAAIVQDMKPMPDLIVRGHVHISTYVEADGHCALGLFPMQIQTPHAQKSKTPNRMLTRWMGMALIEIFPDLLGTNERPFTPYWLRFRHPPLYRARYVEGGKESWTKRILSRISL